VSPRCWEWTTGRVRGAPSEPSRSGTGSFSSASPGAFQQVENKQKYSQLEMQFCSKSSIVPYDRKEIPHVDFAALLSHVIEIS
jgi:hypothetical protein